MFAGIELHRTVLGRRDGWVLGYTSVEAGQRGGRRPELILEAVPASKFDPAVNSTSVLEDTSSTDVATSEAATTDPVLTPEEKADHVIKTTDTTKALFLQAALGIVAEKGGLSWQNGNTGG